MVSIRFLERLLALCSICKILQYVLLCDSHVKCFVKFKILNNLVIIMGLIFHISTST